MCRRLRMARLVLLAALALASAAAFAQQPLVRAVGPIGMTVSDVDRAADFYSRVLHFRKVSEREVAGEEFERLKGVFGARARVVRMQLGEEQIELTEYLAPRGQPVPADFRSNDRWFQHIAIIVRDMDQAYAWLRQHRVAHASSGPQTLPDWNPNAGGIRAFYFRDPDGHHLEILEFPRGKGDPKWQRPGGGLFLGIDHTAIVVADTDASLAFYLDLLGMQVAGESENYGGEQERLNSVFAARLRITALRAASGPGIELLEYLAPRDGRAYPLGTRPNDLIHWETHLEGDAEAVWHHLRRTRTHFISPGPQGATLLVRDPDGHVLAIGGHQERTAK
jgi:catechol 2,3-dioxygenase-like lactoylglutathione lyase family enzyme